MPNEEVVAGSTVEVQQECSKEAADPAEPAVAPEPAASPEAEEGEDEEEIIEIETGADGKERVVKRMSKKERKQNKSRQMDHLKNPELDWIFIGGADDAKDIEGLKRHDIKYILNCTPPRNEKGVLNYHERDPHFQYLRLSMGDNATENLRPHFNKALQFFDRAHTRDDGNILVHCQQGVSRSVSMVLCYLMKYYKISFDEGLVMARECRGQANPNEGFEKQLREFWADLEKNNDFEKKKPPPKKRAFDPSNAADDGNSKKARGPAGPPPGPARGPTGPARGPTGPARGPAVGPARGPVAGPARGPTVGPAMGPSAGPSVGPSVGPAVGPARGPVAGPAKGPAVGPAKGPTVGPARGPAAGPAIGPSRP